MFPITIEQIKADYASTGMKPVRRSWGCLVDKECCPMSARLVATVGPEKARAIMFKIDPDEKRDEVAAAIGLTRAQVDGFTCGLDESIVHYDEGPIGRSQYNEAVKAGQDFRKELFPNGGNR